MLLSVENVNMNGSLSENYLHRLIYLKTLSLVGEIIWEELKAVALLEKMGFKIQKTMTQLAFSASSLWIKI